ncbi:MAG: MFS transporter [Betaproteobacteria bacterium]|nr:MFS transporter [Betaproteobacteria bacterium]
MYLITAYCIACHSAYLGSKVIVSLYALELGASQVTIGVLAALYAIAPLAIGVYAGRIADTRGARAPLVAGAAIIAAGMLAGAFTGASIWPLVVTALLAGAGFMLFNVPIQTLTGMLSKPETRAKNFAILSIGYAISTFIGPVSAGFAIDHLGYHDAFWMLALFNLPPMIGFWLARRYNLASVKNVDDKSERSAMALLRQPPVRGIVVISGLIVASNDLFAFYFPVYGHMLNLSASVIGIVLGVFAIAGVITRFALPALLRRWHAERVMAGCLLFAAVAFAVFPLSTNLYFMLVVSFLLGLGLGCGQPLSMTIGFNRSPEGRAGEVTGLRLSANNLARVIIPVVCGALGGAFGAAPVFIVNAFNLAAISYALWRQ